MDDLRTKFFITLSGFYLGVSEDVDVIGNEILRDFIFKENMPILYASSTTNESHKQIQFLNEVAVVNSCLVVFYKTRPCILTDKNMPLLQITSLSESPSAALYHSLHNVFTPLFSKQDKKNLSYNSIQKQLTNLQAGLRNNILLSDVNEPLKADATLSVIESLDQEVDYWNAVAKSTKVKEQQTGVKFREILQPLARDFSVLDALPLTDVEDLLENAHNVLDDLWRHEPPYPKIRIQHLMDLIANDVIKCATKSFTGVKIWSKDFNVVSELLQQCISVLKHWESSCRQLTEIFWPNYSLHVWSGGPYLPRCLFDFVQRLEEILNVRIVHRQIVRLLTAVEEGDLSTDDMFKPFEDLSVLECDSYTDPLWKTAIKKFEYLLQPAEQRVAIKLKSQLSNITNTRQLLYEFGRYSELIGRPVVKKALQTERQYLLTSLKDYVIELGSLLAEETILNSTKYDTPQAVNKITSTLQLESKANDVQKISEKLLNDLQGNEGLLNVTASLLKDIKQQHNELFDWWTSEISSKIKDETLSLKETDPVVQFSASKMMKVNYSYRLITLIREVRQLTVLGYHIPNNIRDTCNNAKQFIKQARTLEQIANFHNTIGDRMILSQRPMMLASALKLSNLVQEQEVVSWSEVGEVDKYVENLKNAVEVLSKENNLLASYHYQIVDKIKSLEEVDLIKYYQKWKETTKSIGDIIAQVEKRGFKSMQSWKVEIDQQLAHVLEIQYLKSLNTLHLYLPEIHADLVYRDTELQFLPNREILKEKYEQQLQRFLDIPKTFKGVVDSATDNVFVAIIERNREEIQKVTVRTDELMEQLNGVVKHWQSWLTLETLDVTQLKTWEHWELHFRASKTFGQEIAKLPSTEERVGTFIIGLSWLRSDLESHNRSYWSQLTLSLKDSIAQNVFKIQEYVDTSTTTLNKQPLTLDQIENFDSSHTDVLRQKPEMEELFKQMLRKSQMLSSWTRERVDSVNRIKTAWERLQNLLDNYEHVISKQIETMKSSLAISIANLQTDMERFIAKWEQIKPTLHSGQILENTFSELKKHSENIKEKRVQSKELIMRKDKLIQDHKRFDMPEPEFYLFDKTVLDIDEEEQMWTMFEEFSEELDLLGNEEWIVFRKKIYRLEEFSSNWQKKLENINSQAVSTRILQEVRKYQIIYPLLKYLRGDDFTDKHWLEVLTLIGLTGKSIDSLCLSDFLSVAEVLPNYSDELQAMCKRATSEVVVRQALADLDQWDVQCRFILTQHVDSHKKSVAIIKDFKDVLYKIGDNQSLLQSIKNSANYDSFAERVELWEIRLADLDRYVTSLAQIQRKWIYLEPIFRGNTLVQEKARFDRLDKDFRHLMSYVERDCRVTSLNRYPNLNGILESIHDQLSRCQNSLDNFLILVQATLMLSRGSGLARATASTMSTRSGLDTGQTGRQACEKRNKFPRFLFLSDDDLLEVVGQSSKELVIQTHLKKLFAGIHSVQVDSTGKRINAICSLQGEVVPLTKPINIDQPVEDWLNALVIEMQNSLRSLLMECLVDGQNADPLKYPSQILCLSDNISFTIKCEEALSNMTLSYLLTNYKTQLNHYSSLEFKKSAELDDFDDDEESNLLELKLKSLLLDTIHHIVVIEQLIQSGVVNTNDWNWQKQLRYYCDRMGNVTIKMVNAELEYSYEYLGNQPKLVRTPLTEKCFLTMTQGMYLGMGGNPYGPAGTGKTESVKALGSLLGRQVLVFNCDEGIDAASMSLILSGLVRSGAWGCFDEFNRLDETTLSAVSMYIQPIQNALRLNLDTVTLAEQTIKVNKHCGIFITLNPASANYGGRNALPDSLKQLFRPVVMTHPDHLQIATTLLHCDGFKNVEIIGSKLIELFSSASTLMSKQIHYDWGLRSLRTVLSGCSKSIRQYRKINRHSEEISLEDELQLVVKSLRLDTLSKLTFSDSVKFDALIRDTFPNISLDGIDNEILINALKESCTELKIKINERQIAKCVKLYEQLKQRMGVAIVGPPNSGKSTLRNLLFNALIKMGKMVKQHVFNPKSMQRSRLLGKINVDTRQWTDGVLTMYSLQVTAEPLDVWSWIVCDGDVDPEWIESLNSVLDDNKILSLPSGWRIQFGPNVNFIFETHTMSCASPATISRLGIVFLSEEDSDLRDFAENFVAGRPENCQLVLNNCLEEYFYKGVNLVTSESQLSASFSKISVARTVLSHLKDVTNKTQFSVGLLNGLGVYLDYESRKVFGQQVLEWTGQVPPNNDSPFYYYNKDRDIVDVYTNTISSLSVNLNDTKLSLIITARVCHYLDTFRLWLRPGSEQHFLIVGPRGSAKTLILGQIVEERSDLEMITIYCNNNLSPNHITFKLSQCCLIVSSSKGRIYKPKKMHLVLYLKNMHLLKNDRWGTNMLVAFLQQLISYKGFFDENLEWIGVENFTIIGSAINTCNLCVRFTSSIHLFNIDLPQEEELNLIFESYISSLINKSSIKKIWPNNKTNKLVSTLIMMYSEISNTFSSLKQQHYNFTPVDLTKWCQSILRYNVESDTNSEHFLLEVLMYDAIVLFGDRLVDENDRLKLYQILNEILRSQWGINNLLESFENTFYVPPPFTNITQLSKCISEEWIDVIKTGITQYEREGEDMNILIIPEVVKLTARAAKTLTEPGGNLLLIGRTGVGRRSALKIASALYSARIIIPTSTNQPQFNNDLKMAIHEAALEEKDVYLVFEDHILNNRVVLDTVNSLLNSTEVFDLYSPSELEALLLGLKDSANQKNYEGNIYDFFVSQTRSKLHIVTCLECSHEKFGEILETCPSLYEKCNVLWLSEWKENSMRSFPKLFIQKNAREEEVQCTPGFWEIHSSVKLELASPSRFISLIKTYINIYREKKKVISNRQKKLQGGVAKLTEARSVVAELKIKAAQQQEQLEEKRAKANTALDMITNTMKNANSQKQEMEVLKQRTEQESHLIGKRKEEIEKELLEVKPLIESAQAAVGNIKSEALSEIRSLRAPPDIIRDILEGVLRLMGTQDTSWNSMKNFLSKRGIKEDIRSFDASKIKVANRQAVERLMSSRSDSFDSKNAKRASVAAAPLAAWVMANVRYSTVLDKIKPLEREQNKLKENLSTAELQLEELSTGLTDVNTAVAKLKERLNTYTKEAAEIEIHLNAAQDVLSTAEELVAKLNDEYERWQLQLKELSIELESLSYNCLLAAAFITYLSKESEDDRARSFNDWLQALPMKESTKQFKLVEFLTTERQQLQWQSEGLPSDELSVQNAITILEGIICPLLLDPTSTAANWVKRHFKDQVVEVVSQNSLKFNTTLELAIRFGKVLIIEEIESISSVLYGILRNQVVYQGERKLINVNGKLIDFHNNFKLFLCCRNSDFELPSDVTAYINIINFVTSRTGLAEQLLTAAIKQESPKLEERRLELLKQREQLQEKEYNLQNRLLEDLTNASGDILQNKNLMNSLNETKASANAISAALVESSEVHEKLKKEYDVYKDISVFGSSLYFAVSEFANVNVLYSLSIAAFVRLFLKSLSSYETSNVNFEVVQKSLVQTAYTFMSRGIYKKDRLMFALHLCHKLLPHYVRSEEWNIFTGRSFISNAREQEPLPSWIPDSAAQYVAIIRANLSHLYEGLQLTNGSLWKTFLEKNNCETNFPSHCQLSEFQKVLVVQALRPDRLRSTLLQCVLHLTGLRSLDPNVLQLSAIFKESLPHEPVLLLTVSGIDPSSEIKDIARSKIGEDKYVEIAMGEGQESKAVSALNEASKFGRWLILRNLHLVTSLLTSLFQKFQALQHHKDFRLWLITANHPSFSPVLAQNSLKIVYEIPQGLRNNLLHTYSSWGASYVEKLSPTGSRLFFVLACVHSLLQERRTYVPQGWSKFYEFSDFDLWSAVKLSVELYQSQSAQVQWKFLIGLCLDAIYGGRIDNVQDLIIMESYFRQYFKDEVLSHRWKPFDSDLALPTNSNFEDYLNVIKQLSERDQPSYFGLPENINCAWEKNVATEVISKLRDLSVIKNNPLAFGRDSWQKKLIPFMSLWKKLNQGFDYVRVPVPIPNINSSSVVTFISEEYQEGIILIQKIHKYFATLNKIVKGNVKAAANDLELANDLICHRTPKVWQKLWSGDSDPAKYLKSIIEKTNGVSKLKSYNSLNEILKTSINLAILFHPRKFFSALKQDISRKCAVPIDDLILQTTWKQVDNENVIIINGLLLEGAIFDGYSLSSCLPNSDSISLVPDCYVYWMLKKNLMENGKTVDVPLYLSSNRVEVLIHIQVPSNFREKDKWIKTGLAFFTTY